MSDIHSLSNATCQPLLLTLRLGPNSGTTAVNCTCGWDRTYKTRRKAEKRTREHVALTGRGSRRE